VSIIVAQNMATLSLIGVATSGRVGVAGRVSRIVGMPRATTKWKSKSHGVTSSPCAAA
jgi:hypothetical protein